MMIRSLFLIFSFSILVSHGQITKTRCSTMENRTRLMEKDPGMAQRIEEQNIQLQNWIQDHGATGKTNTTITIPVVVHVVYNTAAENISDAQVLSQIDILNQDFGRQNADTSQTPVPFKALAANTGIQFCLASRDVNGNWTTGIVRKQTSITQFDIDDKVKSNSDGGDDPWDVTKYFNIWVCNLGLDIAGYAEFPDDYPAPSNTYGAVIGHINFGNTGTVLYPYDKGRTSTHEIGHCFNLYHIWGDDGGACSGSDFVDDTPNQADYTLPCATFPFTDACTTTGNGVIFMDYMDYSDDACMSMFTQGQATRMLAAINMYYPTLATSDGCGIPSSMNHENKKLNISLYPNPAKEIVNLVIDTPTFDHVLVQIYNPLAELVWTTVLGGRSATAIDLSNLPPGIYFVRICTDSVICTRKITLTGM